MADAAKIGPKRLDKFNTKLIINATLSTWLFYTTEIVKKFLRTQFFVSRRVAGQENFHCAAKACYLKRL
jgi:hypothetical protein